jgi:hypothetical protein
MALPESFFVREGEKFVSTELTRGPWSNEHQHGGPPSALMARAAENFDGGERFFVARVLVDYFKPIPIAALGVRVEPVKMGKTAQRLLVHLELEGEELARANVLRIRRAENPSEISPRPAALPSPEGLPSFRFPFFRHDVGYHRAIEARYLSGAFGDNQVRVWGRQVVPLVAGEKPTGVQRAIVLADAESGVCNPLDVRKFTFVNPDLVVLFDREPQGEWILMDALSTASPLGVGLAQAALHDIYGPVGRSAQTLVIERFRG